MLEADKPGYKIDKMNSESSQRYFPKGLRATLLDISHLSKRSTSNTHTCIKKCLDTFRKNIHNLFLRPTGMQICSPIGLTSKRINI